MTVYVYSYIWDLLYHNLSQTILLLSDSFMGLTVDYFLTIYVILTRCQHFKIRLLAKQEQENCRINVVFFLPFTSEMSIRIF